MGPVGLPSISGGFNTAIAVDPLFAVYSAPPPITNDDIDREADEFDTIGAVARVFSGSLITTSSNSSRRVATPESVMFELFVDSMQTGDETDTPTFAKIRTAHPKILKGLAERMADDDELLMLLRTTAMVKNAMMLDIPEKMIAVALDNGLPLIDAATLTWIDERVAGFASASKIRIKKALPDKISAIVDHYRTMSKQGNEVAWLKFRVGARRAFAPVQRILTDALLHSIFDPFLSESERGFASTVRIANKLDRLTSPDVLRFIASGKGPLKIRLDLMMTELQMKLPKPWQESDLYYLIRGEMVEYFDRMYVSSKREQQLTERLNLYGNFLSKMAGSLALTDIEPSKWYDYFFFAAAYLVVSMKDKSPRESYALNRTWTSILSKRGMPPLEYARTFFKGVYNLDDDELESLVAQIPKVFHDQYFLYALRRFVETNDTDCQEMAHVKIKIENLAATLNEAINCLNIMAGAANFKLTEEMMSIFAVTAANTNFHLGGRKPYRFIATFLLSHGADEKALHATLTNHYGLVNDKAMNLLRGAKRGYR